MFNYIDFDIEKRLRQLSCTPKIVPAIIEAATEQLERRSCALTGNVPLRRL